LYNCYVLQIGDTALHKAAYRGHKDVVDRLVNAYPDMIMKITPVSEKNHSNNLSDKQE